VFENFIVFQSIQILLSVGQKNETVQQWINQRIQWFQPARVHLCDGSDDEYYALIQKQIQTGTVIQLNPTLRPNSYLARSTQADTARVEDATYICSESKSNAGPTNNWEDPEKMQRTMEQLFGGAMRGRTMYVVPYCMGPLDSPFAIFGLQVTDSPYVVCSMRVMTRMGLQVLDELHRQEKFWVPCVHSVGMPLKTAEEQDSHWPCNDKTKYIVHFPEERRIWSFGSGYGGNAILGKKCLALRIGSVIAREEGWLAEHMLIVGITNPKGVKKYFLGCFPSACGKTNLAMLDASLSTMNDSDKWKVECLGDDIAWIRYNNKDGKLYAINPENGFFGVAPGTSFESNPNAMKTISKNTIFTNVAVTEDNDVWWEGMTRDPPHSAIAWTRQEWSAETLSNAAHPNSRFCVPITQCPMLDKDWNNPNGVPISGILFGGRRSTTIPLVYQTFNWKHGVFAGSIMSSETTAAAAGLRGVLRVDPFSMRPFCGYNMADYFNHWLSFDKASDNDEKNRGQLNKDIRKLPKMFCVNWFRKEKGRFLWPGFSENLRVLKWIFDRVDQKEDDLSNAVQSPVGLLPKIDNNSLDISNLKNVELQKLFHIDNKEMLKETEKYEEFYNEFGDRLPKELTNQLKSLRQRLAASKSSD